MYLKLKNFFTDVFTLEETKTEVESVDLGNSEEIETVDIASDFEDESVSSLVLQILPHKFTLRIYLIKILSILKRLR